MFAARRMSVLLVLFSLGLLSCRVDVRAKEVENSVNFARQMLERTKTDQIIKISFASSAELGGDVTAFLAANIEEPAGFASYVWMGPKVPYSVVIRPGKTSGEYIIDGYAANIDKPAMTETVKGVGGK